MKWTSEKPTNKGYYWIKMDHQPLVGYSKQAPRVVRLGMFGGEDMLVMELDRFEEEAESFLEDMSEHFEWSDSPIELPC